MSKAKKIFFAFLILFLGFMVLYNVKIFFKEGNIACSRLPEAEAVPKYFDAHCDAISYCPYRSLNGAEVVLISENGPNYLVDSSNVYVVNIAQIHPFGALMIESPGLVVHARIDVGSEKWPTSAGFNTHLFRDSGGLSFNTLSGCKITLKY